MAASSTLPPVEKAAVETIASHGLKDRIDFVRGDFFRDPLPAADLYILLEKAYGALPSHDAICIVENLLNGNRDGPALTAVINLTMLRHAGYVNSGTRRD